MLIDTQANLPTRWGDFIIHTFEDGEHSQPHIALIHQQLDRSNPVLVRLHSECITGDLFGSKRCDCGAQFNQAMEVIGKEKGVMIYLRQEGRGIGIVNKLKAYNLQDLGLDTVEANVHLGFEPDERDFNIAIQILKLLNIVEVALLTNNPEKIEAIENSDIKMGKRVPLIIKPEKENENYISTKINKLGHLL